MNEFGEKQCVRRDNAEQKLLDILKYGERMEILYEHRPEFQESCSQFTGEMRDQEIYILIIRHNINKEYRQTCFPLALVYT